MPGTTLGTAYIQIAPSAQGIEGSITNMIGGEAQAAGTSAGSKIASFAKKALIAAGIGTAVVKGIKASIDEGAKLQQSYLGGLDTLYGDAADAAREYAREAASAGISMNSYSEQAVSFGAALKSAYGGDTMKAAEAANTAILDMADNAAKMGTPLESIQTAYQGFAKQNYTMLDNLKLGYGGTKSEMERLLADAQKISGVEYNIDNLGDVYDAIHVIQGDLGLTGVAAKEASETFSGSFGAMKAAAQNLMGSIALGENIEPALGTLMSTARTFLVGNLIPMVGTVLSSLPGVIVTVIREGIPVLLKDITGLLGNFATSAQAFAGSITSEKVAEWAKTSGVQMLQKGGEILLKFISGLLSNMGKLVGALGQIGIEIVTGLGSAIWEKVSSAGEKVKEKFLTPIRSLRDKVKEIIDKIKGFFSFNISAPHIPLPHFSITPAGWKLSDLLKGVRPSLGIEWYAKGGIMTKPTVFAGGEAGNEGIIPLDPFWKKLDKIAESSGGTTVINVYPSTGMDEEALAQKIERKLIETQNRRRLAWG